ncbi:TOBE domain-containing protein [Snodgrassella gandavensis]|uniref:TOBE domain-containing protein n=2 Tax=Snodgrassella gandavensis TaxID=2946698 RepID=UPI001EF43633|nr:TOBE domain-containing protein [Snodgrassella gandavensis]
MGVYIQLPEAAAIMNEFNLDTELIPTINGQRIGNSKRIALLENIQRFGSITQAAKAVPMSYKAAWDAIDALNNLAPQPLVLRQTGGQGGGNSVLTAFGEAFLDYYHTMQQRHQQLLRQLHSNADPSHYGLWQKMNLDLSADNQLAGIVSQIIDGTVNNEVHLRLNSGQELVAMLTRHSCEQMELAVGVEALALIQASAIILARPDPNLLISARNQLSGIIRHIDTGTVNSVITVDLGAALSLTASMTRHSAENMQLDIGDEIILLIKAPGIILARLR